MSDLNLFIPLRKADEATRTVYGWVDETPDHAREIMDYAKSKPRFEAWSKAQHAASGGKSYGNVRGQHGKIASGILSQPLEFDDLSKRIAFTAEIVDDNEWEKVLKGVYTGFSPGGSYGERWPDTAHARHTRYEALPTELSIVDKPCIPSAGFQLTKADGSVEEIAFTAVYEPTNDEVKAMAEEMAKAAGGKRNDFVIRARAELIKRHAEAPADQGGGGDDGADTSATDPADALAAALAKAKEDGDYGDVKYADPGYQDDKKPRYPVDTEKHIRAAWNYINKPKNAGKYSDDQVSKIKGVIVAAWKKVIDKDGPPSADKAVTADSLRQVAEAFEGKTLIKGLYTLGWVANLLEEFDCLEDCVSYEAMVEGDGSTQPEKVQEIIAKIGALLTQMAQEEVAELLAGKDIEVEPAMEMAVRVVELVKADGDLMEKVGKRNSMADAARIQGIHDNATSLGAKCDGDNCEDAEKMAKAASDAERLGALVTEATATLEKMVTERETDRATIADLTERLEKMERRPAPGKAVLISIDKSADGGAIEAEAPRQPRNWREQYDALPPGPEKANFLLKHAGYAPGGSGH